MKVLIDGNQKTMQNGYVIEDNQPVSYHSAEPNNNKDNCRCITSGHVYVFNYNAETYKPLKPETYLEYQEMKKNNLPLWISK